MSKDPSGTLLETFSFGENIPGNIDTASQVHESYIFYLMAVRIEMVIKKRSFTKTLELHPLCNHRIHTYHFCFLNTFSQ